MADIHIGSIPLVGLISGIKRYSGKLMFKVIATVVIGFDILPISLNRSGYFGLCLASLYYYVF